MNRRDFLKRGLLLTATLAGIPNTGFGCKKKEFYGMLIDTTICIGCRSCEEACAKANGLPKPNVDKEIRETSTDAFTIVNKFKTEKGEVFVKRQCMHCNQPGCASACLVKAMEKQKEGPVTWNGDRCMGCRYCMIACPFEVPKFEHDSLNPRIRKCEMCWNRLKKGKEPACVKACPVEALMFGTRRELLEIAKQRIYQNPNKYYHKIYGENEVGGTGVIYLSSVPFSEIGFRTDLGLTPIPEYAKPFLYSVPIIFVLWPTFLMAIYNATKSKEVKNE